MTMQNNSNLAKVLYWVYAKIMLNYDMFIVITGGEGTGKSRGLFLNIVDFWYRKILKKPIPQDSYGIDIKDFVKSLGTGKKLDFRGLDEAGDSIDAQNWNNVLNKILYQAYTVIREKKLFTCIVLPSFFDLNPRFRKRRVKVLFNVYKRVDNKCKACDGYFVDSKVCPHCGNDKFTKGYILWRCYNKKQIREILVRNQFRSVKSLNVGVSPVCEGRSYEYKGELLKFYNPKKQEKMKEVLEKVQNEVMGIDGKRVCTHTWIYRKTDMAWWCRVCGAETKESPYSNNIVDPVRVETPNKV